MITTPTTSILVSTKRPKRVLTRESHQLLV
jgi:hypothetical protein